MDPLRQGGRRLGPSMGPHLPGSDNWNTCTYSVDFT